IASFFFSSRRRYTRFSRDWSSDVCSSDLEPSINIEYFGQMAVAVANAGQIKQDIILTVSLALLALFLFITLFYRRIRMFFIAVTPRLFGATVALACLALIKTSVSMISLGVGAVLLEI